MKRYSPKQMRSSSLISVILSALWLCSCTAGTDEAVQHQWIDCAQPDAHERRVVEWADERAQHLVARAGGDANAAAASLVEAASSVAPKATGDAVWLFPFANESVVDTPAIAAAVYLDHAIRQYEKAADTARIEFAKALFFQASTLQSLRCGSIGAALELRAMPIFAASVTMPADSLVDLLSALAMQAEFLGSDSIAVILLRRAADLADRGELPRIHQELARLRLAE